jgi:glycosyltransferase involved in cell wall biosynthesis
VQEFIHQDPLNSPRLALALAWAGQRQTGAVPVYLAHDMGGGAEHYLKNRLKADLEADAAAVVLRVGGLSRWQIELHSAQGITLGGTDSTDFVGRLLGLLPARRIIYSCAVGDRDPIELPGILISLAQGQDDRIEVLVHDYLLLSPAYTLLGSDGVYHGVPMPHTSLDPAHSTIRADGTQVDLGNWRAAWGTLLDAAHQITVFSDNSRTLVAQAYPQVTSKLMVRPHTLLHDVPRVAPGQPRDGIPVIGVLGNIGYQKGITVLRDLSHLLTSNGRARLVIIGNIDPAYPLASSAQVHGDYRIEDIPALVARYGISRWLMPSIGPETFSYTTHEALATGLPVFGFDLGAQGDAIHAAAEASGRGGIIPLNGAETDLEALVDILLNEKPAKRNVA